MRLTVNLDADLYGLAKSVARDADCTISTAINRLLRRSLEAPDAKTSTRRARKRNGLVISKGRVLVTADTVRRAESEDDTA